jgi:hypothetical protein
VEPKKIYNNVMFGEYSRDVSLPNVDEATVKLNKFVRIMRMLTELSHKMIRSISKGMWRARGR